MHPLSTALFLLGYGLALPIGARLPMIVANRNRLALWGHQVGVIIAAGGWLVRGRIVMALLHVVWLFVANAWFGLEPRRRHRAAER